jgi:hypothetical protein
MPACRAVQYTLSPPCKSLEWSAVKIFPAMSGPQLSFCSLSDDDSRKFILHNLYSSPQQAAALCWIFMSEIFLQTKNLSLGHQDPSFLCQVCCCLQTRHFPHDSLAIFLASLTQSSVLATAPALNRQVQHLSFSTPLYKLTAKPAPD